MPIDVLLCSIPAAILDGPVQFFFFLQKFALPLPKQLQFWLVVWLPKEEIRWTVKQKRLLRGLSGELRAEIRPHEHSHKHQLCRCCLMCLRWLAAEKPGASQPYGGREIGGFHWLLILLLCRSRPITANTCFKGVSVSAQHPMRGIFSRRWPAFFSWLTWNLIYQET